VAGACRARTVGPAQGRNKAISNSFLIGEFLIGERLVFNNTKKKKELYAKTI
jgi:hypothetical protein